MDDPQDALQELKYSHPALYQYVQELEGTCRRDKAKLLGQTAKLREDIDQLIRAGDALDKAFGDILLGVKYIALQDYSVLNAGMDWQKAKKGVTGGS